MQLAPVPSLSEQQCQALLVSWPKSDLKRKAPDRIRPGVGREEVRTVSSQTAQVLGAKVVGQISSKSRSR
ncbi:hypothetical protein HYQ46_010713 [Verticillium longisporum]|nr:hypothetical protein HYQ46_010713 [Verticillium longisporum]